MTELFDTLFMYPFLQNALIASVLASIACGIVGTLVVCNRLTFLAGGASHAAYGGIGLSLYFSLPPLLCTLIFTFAASLVMGGFTLHSARKKQIATTGNADSAIGILWALGMAFGIILIELTPGYAGELMGFLFGSILTVPTSDIIAMLCFDALLLLTVGCFYQGIWAISLDENFARARGLPVSFLFLLIVGLTALAVVMLIRIVGLMLVLALLTLPPTLARKMCHTLSTTMVMAFFLSFLFCCSGLVLSWYTNVSSGAAIIATGAGYYFCYLLFEKVTKPGNRKLAK